MPIKRALLVGVSLHAIGAGTAYAKSTPVLVAQMHPGRAVVKTALHSQKPTNTTYTYSVTTTVSTSADYKKKTKLAHSYFTFLNSGTFCNPVKETVKLPTHKTKYAKVSKGIESYSEGCGAPSKFYGDVYDLQTKKGAGNTDQFYSSLIGRDIHYGGTIYKKVTANFVVFVKIVQ
jgi:hypothetical protein